MTASMATSRRDVPHLTHVDLAELRASLMADLATQRDHLDRLHATLDELAGPLDPDGLHEREMVERTVIQRLETTAEIEHVLGRMDDGTYGRCEPCGRMISLERLSAIPHARHCVSCPPPAAPPGR
jgi:RNA polymerase-binding transcription factor DksA